MVPLQRSLLGFGEPAVDPAAAFTRVQLDEHSWVDVARQWLLGADRVLDVLIDTAPWTQGRRWMYERMVDDPRLSCWYRAGSEPPHPALAEARTVLQRRYRVPLQTLGLNYYRDGRDSVASHRDREMRHLDQTVVAIVTLGARRPFLIRPKGGGPSTDIAPASGDLLVMGGRTQADWEHAVPKVAHAGPRISATWRWSSGRGRADRGVSFRAPRRFDRG